MSLQEPNVVDFVGLSPDGREVTLYLIATEPWDAQDDEVMKLQAKLKNYVAFAADGQLERQYPDVVGKKVRIEIRSEHPLSDTARKLVDAARENWCQPEGIALAIKPE